MDLLIHITEIKPISAIKAVLNQSRCDASGMWAENTTLSSSTVLCPTLPFCCCLQLCHPIAMKSGQTLNRSRDSKEWLGLMRRVGTSVLVCTERIWVKGGDWAHYFLINYTISVQIFQFLYLHNRLCLFKQFTSSNAASVFVEIQPNLICLNICHLMKCDL